MCENRLGLALLAVLLVALAGCVHNPPGANITYNGNLSASADGFVMEGEIENQDPNPEGPTHFDNVSVYLYSAEKELIHTEHVGELEREANVSIRIDTVPKYVIISAPGFWSEKNAEVDYYEYTDGQNLGYMVGVVASRDELPVELPQ